MYRFYKGLAPRVKDAITHNDRYTNLWQLKDIAIAIDLRYWEKKEEQAEEHPHPPRTSSGSNYPPRTQSNQQGNKTSNPYPNF